MTQHYLGIDPGKEGALSLVDHEAKLVRQEVMPTLADRVDPGSLFRLLQSMTDGLNVLVYLEKAFCMKGQGVVSVMNYGISAGFCEMALAGLCLPFEMVGPKTWQKVMHQDISTKIKDPKIRSALKAQRLAGSLDIFTPGKRKKPHSGLVDAYLIAVFAQRSACKAQGISLKGQHLKKKKSNAAVA